MERQSVEGADTIPVPGEPDGRSGPAGPNGGGGAGRGCVSDRARAHSSGTLYESVKALHPRATVRVREVETGWQIMVAYTATFREDELDDVPAALERLRRMGP